MCLHIQYHRLLVRKPTKSCIARKIIYEEMFCVQPPPLWKIFYHMIWLNVLLRQFVLAWTVIVCLDRQHALRQHALRHNFRSTHTYMFIYVYDLHTHIYLSIYLSIYLYVYINLISTNIPLSFSFSFSIIINIMTLNLSP